MIILDKPYVSDFLKNTIEKFQIQVVKTQQVNDFQLNGKTQFISEDAAAELMKKHPDTRIYTNSENAINWISKNLSFSHIPEKINLFKDKFLFRELTKDIYPNFYYKLLKLEDFNNLNINEIPKPFIIKPAVGFFSMAVYKVQSNEEWEVVKTKIKEELKAVGHIYPKEVMDTQRFIIEEMITGDEYAFDAYYDADGEPFVLNIMKHVFASEEDFSDRLYITSEKIIREHLQPMECFLRDIGMYAQLKNFPLHVEVRIDKNGKMMPIEVNPLRFGAWCTTADATWYAYNFNSIAAYLNDEKPDWDKLLKEKEGKTYAMMVIENSTGYTADQIKAFNYDKLLADFEKPIELRKIDYHQYPVFGFLFVESRDENYQELERILNSDLHEYVELY
jgi:hypothetical protein